jgi:DNA mismatch repair ATPase MutS
MLQHARARAPFAHVEQTAADHAVAGSACTGYGPLLLCCASHRTHCCAGAILQLACDGQLSSAGLCELHTNSLKLLQRPSTSSCRLGINTLLSLGVIADSSIVGQPQWSLCVTIEHFLKTKQGRRLLRACLLQPLTSVPTITERHNAIAELVEDVTMQETVQTFLTHAPRDVNKCLPALPRAAKGPSTATTTVTSAFIQAVLRLRSLLHAAKVRSTSPHDPGDQQVPGAEGHKL